MTGSASLFSVELRRRRQAAGRSLGELAAEIHYSKGYLSKVETGIKPASANLARRCDASLGAGGALAALVGHRVPAPPADDEAVDDREVWIMTFDPAGSGGRYAPVSRRRALAAGAVSLMEWQLGGADRAAPVAHTAVGSLTALFDAIRALGRTARPAAVLPVVIAQVHTLRGLAANADRPTRDRLLLLAGRHAEYAGWMAQEAGQDRAALWWTDAAVEFAEAVDDKDLKAYAWVRKAGVMLYRRDAAGVIELARHAGQQPGVPPRIRGLAARREAQGHALAGDAGSCSRALDQALDLLGSSAGDLADGTLSLGSTSVPDQHALVTGWCLYDVGQPRSGAEVLDRTVASMPPDAKRAAARFGARRALAHAAAGEIDHACAIAEHVLDAAGLVDSATVRSDLRELARTLMRWQSSRTVRELLPRLTQAHYPRPVG
jgi:transcriptional regulator with XRE-family HTH domain